MPIIILFIVIAIIVSLAGVFMNPDKNVSFLPEEITQEQQVSQGNTSAQNKSSGTQSQQSQTKIDPNFPIDSYIKYGAVKQDTFNETTEVTFEFDAVISSSVNTNEFYFETKAEGVDTTWQRTNLKYRTVKFPDGPKEYTFGVRGRTNTLTETTPAYTTIKINVSPYYNEINISTIKIPDATANPSLITISTNIPSGQTINITGWKLEGKKGSVLIPSGAEKYNPENSSSWQQNILLKQGDQVYISSQSSPFAFSQLSFRPNKCIGYYLSSKNFPISIYKNCPNPATTILPSYLSDKCKNFISKNIGICEFPNPTKLSANNMYEDTNCMDYLNLTFNYQGCFRNYSNDSDFTLSQWHIYTDKYEKEIMDRFGDTVYLKDSNGLVVAKYCYEDYCK